MHWHKHPNKTHSFQPTSCMYRIKRQTVRLSGEHHFVLWPTVQQHRQRVNRKQEACWPDTLAGRCCWTSKPERKRRFQLRRLPARSHRGQSIKRLCVLLQNYWPSEESEKFLSQSLFCTFSWFFWIFWWTTFTVVRKFPKNRTRNVSASMNTWKNRGKVFYFKTSHNIFYDCGYVSISK